MTSNSIWHHEVHNMNFFTKKMSKLTQLAYTVSVTGIDRMPITFMTIMPYADVKGATISYEHVWTDEDIDAKGVYAYNLVRAKAPPCGREGSHHIMNLK